MSLEKALADLERKGFLNRVMELEASTATAAQAAEALGVEPGRSPRLCPSCRRTWRC